MNLQLQHDEDGDAILSVVSAEGKVLPLLWIDTADGSINLIQQNTHTEEVRAAGVTLDLFNYPVLHRS